MCIRRKKEEKERERERKKEEIDLYSGFKRRQEQHYHHTSSDLITAANSDSKFCIKALHKRSDVNNLS